jgi:hypothetical protein
METHLAGFVYAKRLLTEKSILVSSAVILNPAESRARDPTTVRSRVEVNEAECGDCSSGLFSSTVSTVSAELRSLAPASPLLMMT